MLPPSRRTSRLISIFTLFAVFLCACSAREQPAEVIQAHVEFNRIDTGHLEARKHHTQVWMDGDLIVWGGYSMGGDTLPDGAIFSEQKGEWKSVSKSPISSRSHQASVIVDDHLFIWGGFSTEGGDGQPSTGALYSPKEDSWVEIEKAPEGRAATQAEYVDGLVVISGGLTPTRDLLVFSVLDDSWRRVPFSDDDSKYHVLGADSFENRVVALASDSRGFHLIDYRAGEDRASISPLSDIENSTAAGISFSGKGDLYVISMGSMSSRLHHITSSGRSELLFEDPTKTFRPNHLTAMHPFNRGSMEALGDRTLVSSGTEGFWLWDVENGNITDIEPEQNKSFCGPLSVQEGASMIGWIGANECGLAGASVDLGDHIH